MNKQALSKFAPYERRRLREAVQKRLAILGITEKSKFKTIREWLIDQDGIIAVNNKQYTDYKKSTFEQLFIEYQQVGYDTLVEEIAYTWFNRLIAIRYMEVRDVLPDYIKILGNNGQSNQPEILNDYSYLSVDKAEIESLKMNNQEEAAYRKLFLAAANKLGDVMPFLFEKLQDWTELVLPERMLESGGIIERIVTNEGLTNSFQDGVEAIGWLYQYYITEVKEKVMEMKKVEKEYVPARTQIFTPKWIVKYMVENSLGQLWIDANPDTQLKNMMTYHIEEPSQSDSVKEKLERIRYQSAELEELKFLDPAVGSGHILSYAFELFYEMYVEEGYSKRDIPNLILEKNLYGIDIDDRAAQLAAFTLTMKAADSMGRSYWRNVVIPNVISIQQSNTIDQAYVEQLFRGKQLDTVEKLLETYQDAKEYGSLLKPNILDITELERSFLQTTISDNEQYSLFNASHSTILDPTGQSQLIQKLIKQQKLLTKIYDVVVANPPYMGNSTMSKTLSDFAKKVYPDSKADLFAMFMERIFEFTKENGFSSNVTMQSWMFLSTYEKLRSKITGKYGITTLLHMDNNVMGIAFGTAATVFRKHLQDYLGQYMYVTINDIKDDQPIEFPIVNERYKVAYSNGFSAIPGSTIAYWATEKVKSIFENSDNLKSISEPRQGMATTNNSLFLRLWYETDITKIGFNLKSEEESKKSNLKWFPYNKGGAFRKWFGNNDYIVNFEDGGKEVCDYIDNYSNSKVNHKGRVINREYYFKESITWSFVSSSYFGVRYSTNGFIFDVGGSSVFPRHEDIYYLTGFLCSKLSFEFMKIQNPTLNFQVGNVANLPIIVDEIVKSKINELVIENIEISKSEWDSYETSWGFMKHPFIVYREGNSLDNSFKHYESIRKSMFDVVKANEEELNRIFIEVYGLEDELSPNVDNITIRLADIEKDTKSFLSYFIGCLMGRYSLDIEGLAFAGGEFDWENYKTFVPSNDGIVTFTDEKVLPDKQDVYERLKEFLLAIYGQKSLMQNLAWIAEGLGKKDSNTVEATIRNYFLNEFFENHCKQYTDSTGKGKRPIYWLIDSGKQKGMQSLVYLHRYTPQTIGLAMQNHFIPLLTQWRKLVQVTEAELDSESLSTTEKLNMYKKRSEELSDFQDSLNELSRQEISLDLDDGVMSNYLKIYKIANVLYDPTKIWTKNTLIKYGVTK